MTMFFKTVNLKYINMFSIHILNRICIPFYQGWFGCTFGFGVDVAFGSLVGFVFSVGGAFAGAFVFSVGGAFAGAFGFSVGDISFTYGCNLSHASLILSSYDFKHSINVVEVCSLDLFNLYIFIIQIYI